MHEALFQISEGFQSENIAPRRERMGQIMDGYLRARLAAGDGGEAPATNEILLAAK